LTEAGQEWVAMGWVRTRRKLGGWLALFALALQLALSLGHIHAEDFAPKPGLATLAHADESPAEDGDHHGLGHADCAICAVIHLGATLLLPVPPQVPLPATDNFAWLAATDRHDLPRASRQPFQARAPPQT
jgi:hypothetical protein